MPRLTISRQERIEVLAIQCTVHVSVSTQYSLCRYLAAGISETPQQTVPLQILHSADTFQLPTANIDLSCSARQEILVAAI